MDWWLSGERGVHGGPKWIKGVKWIKTNKLLGFIEKLKGYNIQQRQYSQYFIISLYEV